MLETLDEMNLFVIPLAAVGVGALLNWVVQLRPLAARRAMVEKAVVVLLVLGAAGLAALAVIIALLPLAFPNNYYYDVAIRIGMNATIVVGLNLLIGYAGQISLGHAGFFGLGAYATWWLAPAFAAAAVVANVFSFPSTSMR